MIYHMLRPPVSTILKFTPNSASFSAIFLREFASSLLGVGGRKLGQYAPPGGPVILFIFLLLPSDCNVPALWRIQLPGTLSVLLHHVIVYPVSQC